MRQKFYSTLVIVFLLFFLFLYATLLESSLELEENKSLRGSKTRSSDSYSRLVTTVSIGDSFWYETYVRNPANVELYLRSKLHNLSNNEGVNDEELISLYLLLLKTRPSWPYYFSGLTQIQNLVKGADNRYFINAIQKGPHEIKVVYSLAEMLFYNWDNINKSNQILILDYLIDQPESTISATVNISANFAKIYEYCDYIYSKKHVEYRACKQHYWQPLLD